MDTHTPSTPPQPLASTAGWVSMRHLQQATTLAKAIGLGMDELPDADQLVPLQTIEAILDALQHEHGEQLLGLHMASHMHPTTLGAIGHLLQACNTFADLLDVVVRHNGLLSNIGRTSVVHEPGLVVLQWACLSGSPLLRRHATDYVIGSFVVLIRLLTQGTAAAGTFPVAVHLNHPKPEDPERAKEYLTFFACPVHFGQDQAAVVAPVALLPLRLPFGDATLKALLEQHTSRLLQQRSQLAAPPLPDDVRRLLRGMILSGDPTKEAVARQLGTSTRSLHRRLQAFGTSYRTLLHEERAALACERLRDTRTPVAEIARWLGFSSPQAFLRWFRPLHQGLTPSQYRRQAGGTPTP